MAALIILPLLLVFGLLDFGGGDEESSENENSDSVAADDPDRVGESDGSLTGLLDVTTTSNGADEVFGAPGVDAIDGQGGDDRLLGFDSTDYLEGGAGNDVLRGGDGADVLSGGTGDDKLVGGRDFDLLLGNAGNDLIEGNSDDDILAGGQGADTLNGGDGSDVLYSFLPEQGYLPADDDSTPPDMNAEYILAYDIVLAGNPDLTPEQADAIMSGYGIGEADLSESPSDGQRDVLNGGAGPDLLFLGGGDEGTGGSGEDGFVVLTGNGGADAAVITDFEQNQDYVIVDYIGSVEPSVTVEDDGADALILADGVVLAILSGGAGEIEAADVALVRSG